MSYILRPSPISLKKQIKQQQQQQQKPNNKNEKPVGVRSPIWEAELVVKVGPSLRFMHVVSRWLPGGTLQQELVALDMFRT